VEASPGRSNTANQRQAQQSADRIRLLREELATPELQRILALTPDQESRFDEWSRARLADLARQFDVDTSTAQKRVSWGMRIVSTLGGLAICAAVVLFFVRYWGYLDTSAQVAIVALAPLIALAGVEFAAARERTLYFTGLLALVALALFVMDLAVLGNVFNILSTERALLAWGVFALLLAYRYGLRLHLALALLLLIGYGAALVTAQFGYRWFDFDERPELVGILALLVFWTPLAIPHKSREDFPPVYRLVGAIVFFVSVLSLAEWGIPSYLPFSQENIERLYEFAGLLTSAGAIWLALGRQWNGVVNTAATAFAMFLFARLYHWWWDWLPKYLFSASIGALGIALVLVFKRVRTRMARAGALA